MPRRTHTITYDRYSLRVDGRRLVLFGGEYQFWRTPSPERWPVVLREMRAAGLNTVAVGVSWQYHSPAPGVYDFSGIRDLARFLDAAAAAGLYVIARPGPAYDAESNASNLPGWLMAGTGNIRANSGLSYCGAGAYSRTYAAAYRDWFRHVLPFIATRQITTGHGSVVALQIENEYAPQCGAAHYMNDLHDLARRNGITVPLLANNNSCCANVAAWHTAGRDGRPIVDLPAEDDYPCADLCPNGWNGLSFRAIDTLEARLRAAGVANAPVAVAELQGGYFTGWGQADYSWIDRALAPSFFEVLDGSVLGQGATLVSTYMVAGGTSWGYMAGPNTETSYDYGAPIHEWGTPSANFGSLKRTGMFVDAFGDLLGATRRSNLVTASNPALLYAVRETLDGPQRGALFIVLRNTDPLHWSDTRLRLSAAGAGVMAPGSAIRMPPHALALLVANYHLGPFHLLYSTSRPLTQAAVDGEHIAVLYGTPGTAGETALAFATPPRILRVDAGIAARYDAATRTLHLVYTHDENLRYVVLSDGRQRLILALTGPAGAARTWRMTTPSGPSLVTGPALVTGPTTTSGGTGLRVVLDGATRVSVWSSGHLQDGLRAGTISPDQHAGTGRDAVADGVRQWRTTYDATLGAHVSTLIPATSRLALPALTTWRFMTESPETQPSFNDAGWTAATHTRTTNPNVPPGDTLLADDYGFHYGFVWYRGHFSGTGTEQALRVFGRHSYSVWLNGVYLGSSTLRNDLTDAHDELAILNTPPSNNTYADSLTFPIPSGLVARGDTNTIAVLTESLGHNIGFENGELSRSPVGLLSARLTGPAVPPTIAWRIQGATDDQNAVDSPLNASGLYGERNGWYRAGFDDLSWPTVHVPDNWVARGLRLQGVGWYRTGFDLNLPPGVDAPLGLVIPHAQDKVLIWLNGLLIGRYWEQAGPQHIFYLPGGLLREHGHNTLALAVWNRGHDGGLTGGVSLQPYGVSALATVRW